MYLSTMTWIVSIKTLRARCKLSASRKENATGAALQAVKSSFISHTEGWVDHELLETLEGDEQAVGRIHDFLRI
jgi:hypothetical protein